MKRNTSLFRKVLSLFLVVCMLSSFALSYSASVSAVDTSWQIVMQNLSKWASVYYGSGSLKATGCGNFALVNAVGYLTGKDMDVTKVAQWAYDIGGYNDTGANGTNRFEVYPYVEAKWGSQYGFTVNLNGGSGWWSSVNNSVLKNHLANGGTAVAHVPNHFIALVGYDYSTDKFHVLDSYPTTGRGTSPGDVYRTTSQLTGSVSAMKIDWWFLLSEDNSSISSAPTINAATTCAHNTAMSVSWGAVNNAVSYKYKVEKYDGEMSGTAPTTIVPETTTTGTSFTIPGQASGKYYKVTVTAVGEKDSKSASAVVMVGPWASYPSKVQYIPVNEINGTVTSSNSCILTYDFTTGMSFTYWRGFMLSPASDGTYVVDSIYEYGVAKTIDISNNNLVFMIHQNYEGFEYAKNIVVGDKLTLNGIYVDKSTIRGSGHILVNGGIPLAPESITPNDNVGMEKDDVNKAFIGLGENTTAADTIKKFKEDNSYLEIRKADGTVLDAAGYVGTGCTVNVVVDGTVTLSYALVVVGDINGDAGISSADYILQKQVISGTSKVSGAAALAVDFNGDKTDSAADYIALRAKIAGN